ncbi:MAG: hypothetical protein COA78_09975 [Blastopirellula sp.]|nr:MAG: hypothetical protein COA78_09975 [Blastopirellula sp.]
MQLSCPHCTTVLNIESPAGTEVQCPSCSGQFVVPNMPVSAPAPGVVTQQAASQVNTEAENPEEGAEEGAEESGREIPWKKFEKIGYTVLFSVISGASIFIVIYFFINSFNPTEEGSPEVVYNETPNAASQIQNVMAADEAGEIDITWVNASREGGKIRSAIKDGFRVRVTNVEWGEVRGKDATGALVTSERPYIIIFLKTANRSYKTKQFKSWYGNQFDTPAGPRTAQLSNDNKDIFYPMIFDDIKTLQFHTAEKLFQPQEESTDAIVFDVPEDFDPAAIENLYLDLPCQAIGTGGSFRFRIPNSMIQGN